MHSAAPQLVPSRWDSTNAAHAPLPPLPAHLQRPQRRASRAAGGKRLRYNEDSGGEGEDEEGEPWVSCGGIGIALMRHPGRRSWADSCWGSGDGRGWMDEGGY